MNMPPYNMNMPLYVQISKTEVFGNMYICRYNERGTKYINAERVGNMFTNEIESRDKLIDDAAECIKSLRHTLEMVSVVDQGCGGNLKPSEMAESAMRQAKKALPEADNFIEKYNRSKK